MIKVDNLYSPDLEDSENGLPEDLSNFKVFMGVDLFRKEWGNPQLFYFTVISKDYLAQTKDKTFITQTLVLEKFDRLEIIERIKKLVFPLKDEKDFSKVITYLKPYLEYAT